MLRLIAVLPAWLAAAKLSAEPPIISGAAPVYLDGEGWIVSNAEGSIVIGGSVPGDLVSDLETAGVIGDPLYQMNFLPPTGAPPAPGAPYGQPIWDNQTWVYNRSFSVPWDPATASFGDVQLVFDGVKMAADVSLNGVYVGRVADMFYRYAFPGIASILRGGTNEPNTLTLSFFQSNDTANNEGRWDSCSGGWDWAFYSQTHNPSGPDLNTFSKGIWKSVYLLPIPAQQAAIQHVVPLVWFNGSYPTAPMADGANGPWTVSTTVHFTVPAATTGTLTVTGDWPGPGNTASQSFSLPAGNASATLSLTAANVNLWWPNGMGGRAFYNVAVTWTPATAGVPAISDSRRIGFRTVYLVTADDSNPASLAGKEGSGNFTMRWKVNGADMYARGGNIIPMDEMEGRMSDAAYTQMVRSASTAGFNAFRVWGGGIYGPDAFYNAADEEGILMYHDAMYSSDGRIPPANTQLEDAELKHNIRRLASHPSIGHWDSCNECDPVGQPVYYTFVATVMSQEDPSRPIWPSCPSQGWWSGVYTLTGLPNGNPLIPIGAKGTGSIGSGAFTPEDGVRAPARLPGQALPDPRPDAALPVITSTAGDAAGNCTVQVDVDYDKGTMWLAPQATDPGDCCAQCSANPLCWVGVFWQGTCYFKNQTQASLPVYGQGCVAVWPAGKGPIPPAPPIYVTVEAHGPYQHGGGFPGVNGDPKNTGFGANIPITLAPSYTQYGPHAPGTFYSEFGASVWSSFESVAPTLEPTSWGLGGGMAPNPEATCQGEFSGVCPGPNPISQRNYPPHNFIYTYFAPSSGNFAGLAASLNLTGVPAFQRQLYLAVLAQGLEMKADIYTRRASPHTATIYWQFNEIWPTGGWGSVEYGTVGHTPGQVLGGRWKTLHHWVSSMLYVDTFISCGGDGRCLVRNDNAMAGLTGTAAVSILNLRSTAGPSAAIVSVPITLPRGFGAVQQFCLGNGNVSAGCEALSSVLSRNGCAGNGTDCMLLTSVVGSDGVTVMAKSWELLATPGTIWAQGALPNPAVTVSVNPTPNADGTVDVTVTSTTGSPALFVTLTTLAQGRFSDNAIVIPGGAAKPGQGPWASGSSTTVRFHGFPEGPGGTPGPVDMATLVSTLRVEHLGQYMP